MNANLFFFRRAFSFFRPAQVARTSMACGVLCLLNACLSPPSQSQTDCVADDFVYSTDEQSPVANECAGKGTILCENQLVWDDDASSPYYYCCEEDDLAKCCPVPLKELFGENVCKPEEGGEPTTGLPDIMTTTDGEPTGNDTNITTSDNSGSCGDGQVNDGEECDDGNRSDVDACTTLCKSAVCGDGFVQEGVEQCDTKSTLLPGTWCVNLGTCTITCEPGFEECHEGDKFTVGCKAQDSCTPRP